MEVTVDNNKEIDLLKEYKEKNKEQENLKQEGKIEENLYENI